MPYNLNCKGHIWGLTKAPFNKISDFEHCALGAFIIVQNFDANDFGLV